LLVNCSDVLIITSKAVLVPNNTDNGDNSTSDNSTSSDSNNADANSDASGDSTDSGSSDGSNSDASTSGDVAGGRRRLQELVDDSSMD